ncbi:hypothetical protein [Natronorubrum thiooxidans]|uniref:Uncharacterized protein n=1 Tax=Natronorubrum thiooxidans TaxID=308853 RepID=A0A1N7EX95_9EURY|nr:hypothetical protein [Natronorubrum thiooxidans]SIR92709.1 hypothetical protein SAMN05421752_105145 [Natronorubrum thiooxidans]
MTDDETMITDSLGLLVFFLSSLVAIFIGPLEAVLAIGLYWLFESESENTATE